jgi:prophage antirepressor-like protein
MSLHQRCERKDSVKSALYEALGPFTSQFSGQDITTVFWNGRPCWTAKDIGRALGYGRNGLKLGQRITQDWRHEFIEENDFVLIQGENLVAFKKLLEVVPDSGTTLAPRLLVFFETGLNLVCIKTRKPAGQHLRRWLASEVLPQLRETGSYELGQPGGATDAQSRLCDDIEAAAVQRREDIKTLAVRRREALASLKEVCDLDLLSQDHVTRYVLHSVAIIDGSEPLDGPELILASPVGHGNDQALVSANGVPDTANGADALVSAGIIMSPSFPDSLSIERKTMMKPTLWSIEQGPSIIREDGEYPSGLVLHFGNDGCLYKWHEKKQQNDTQEFDRLVKRSLQYSGKTQTWVGD